MLRIRFSNGDRLEYEGPGAVMPLDNEGLEIRFEYEGREVCWQVWRDRLVIHSCQEVDVRLPLTFGSVCVAEMKSPWGTMEMEAVLKQYELGDTKVTAAYELEGTLFRFQLEWIKEQ